MFQLKKNILFVFFAGSFRNNGIYLACFFSLLFTNNFCLKAQDSIDLYSTRLFVNDASITYSGKNDNVGISCRFIPSFSSGNINLSYSDFKHGYKEQYYRAFNYKGSVGYVAFSDTLFYDKFYKISDNNYGIYGSLFFYQSFNMPGKSNCFYLLHDNEQGSDPFTFSLRVDNICLNKNSIGVTQTQNSIYCNKCSMSARYPGISSGWASRGRDSKDVFIHFLDGFSLTHRIFLFHDGYMDPISADKTVRFPNEPYTMAVSPNSRMLALPYYDYVYDELCKSVYLYRTEDGKALNFLDSFDHHTLTGFPPKTQPVVFRLPSFSSSGRFMYITETVYSAKPLNCSCPGKEGKYFYDSAVRLLQVDMAPLMHGAKPTTTLLKEWSGTGHGYRVFLHSIAADGRLYYCVEDAVLGMGNNGLPDTIPSLWRINTPDTELTAANFTFHTEKMLDSLPFPIIYREPETYNPASWAYYPYTAKAVSDCNKNFVSLVLHTTVPVDSVIWQPDSTGHILMAWPDTSIQYAFSKPGLHKVVYHVWRKGYEDVVYADMMIPNAFFRHDELRNLPRKLISCSDTALYPLKDSLAQKANWADGYPTAIRKVTNTDTLVWQVWYDTTLCPRNDTVIVNIRRLDSITVGSINTCDTSNAFLRVRNMYAGIKLKWSDSDTSIIKHIPAAGIYAVNITDTVSGCTKDIVSAVHFFKSTPPAWNGKDTLMCPWDILLLRKPPGYEIQTSTDAAISDSFVSIRGPGTYNFLYRPITNPAGICGWQQATVNISADPKNDTICYGQCYLYIPNAFSPDQNGTNDLLGATGNCDMYLYDLQVFNRWGERVFWSSDINKKWDGTFHGNECPDGIYMYSVSAITQSRQKIKKKGTLLLMHQK
jgi:gliding motility-associated-like protein